MEKKQYGKPPKYHDRLFLRTIEKHTNVSRLALKLHIIILFSNDLSHIYLSMHYGIPLFLVIINPFIDFNVNKNVVIR